MSGRTTRAKLGTLLSLSAATPDGLLVLNDGTLIRALSVRALSPIGMSDEASEQTSRSLSEIATLLPDGQALQLLTHAEPFDTGRFVSDSYTDALDTHTALIADHQAQRGEALEWLAMIGAQGVLDHAQRISGMALEHHLVVPWRPSRLPAASRHTTLARLRTSIADLDAHYGLIVSHAQALGLDPRPLNGGALLSSLYRSVNPAREPTTDWRDLWEELTAASAGLGGDALAFLEQTLTGADRAAITSELLRARLAHSRVDTSHPTHLVVDGMPVQCRALSSVPNHTWLGWLLHLMQSPYPFTLSVRWQAGRRMVERRRARQRYRQLWGLQRSRERSSRTPDHEATEREQEAAKLTAELAGTAGAGVYQVAVTLAMRNPYGSAADLLRHTREIEREFLARTDARLHLPIGAQLAAWRTSWPLARDHLGIRRRYTTTNLVHTTPTVAARCGSPSGIPLGWARPGRTLERLDPFDPAHDNAVMVVCGRSGRGKTMAINLILSRILAQGAHCTVIDRAGHYSVLASLVPGAVTINLGTAHGGSVNPWDVEDPGDVPPEKIEFLLALHSFFLGKPQADGTYDLDAADHSQLSFAIRDVYRTCAATGGKLRPRELMLQEALRGRADRARQEKNFPLADRLQNLYEGLHDYVDERRDSRGGAGSYLADHQTTVPEDSPLVVFDTRNVGDARAAAAMFTIFEYTTRRGAKIRAEYGHRGVWGGRVVLVVEEGWSVFDRPAVGRWINERARRSRHDRLFLIAASQQLSDFTKHREGEALASQASMQLFLGQYEEQAKVVQSQYGFADIERQQIAGLKTVKGEYAEAFFCNGRRGRGLIEVRAGAHEYWIATSEPDHDQPLRDELLAQHDDPRAAIEQLAAQHAPLTGGR